MGDKVECECKERTVSQFLQSMILKDMYAMSCFFIAARDVFDPEIRH